MFTGIISHIGTLQKRKGPVFTFSAPLLFLKKVKRGTSVSINGTCLTISTSPSKQTFSVELMPETIKRTVFGQIKPSDIVNLELPATAQTFLSGHIVQGHVDTVGIIKNIQHEGNSELLKIEFPKNVNRYIVPKGSIAVNGISLTVVDVLENVFTVAITPFTWRKTMLYKAEIGDHVNIEVDIIAKYVEKLLRG